MGDATSVAGKIFREYDVNGDGSLDGEELLHVFSELAKVNGISLSPEQMHYHIQTCLQYGVAGSISEAQFQKYFEQKAPQEFSRLHKWRELFCRYSVSGTGARGADREMHEEHAVKIIYDLHQIILQPKTQAEAQELARGLFCKADVGMKGAINFYSLMTYVHEASREEQAMWAAFLEAFAGSGGSGGSG
jgi:hypothetical protein